MKMSVNYAPGFILHRNIKKCSKNDAFSLKISNFGFRTCRPAAQMSATALKSYLLLAFTVSLWRSALDFDIL